MDNKNNNLVNPNLSKGFYYDTQINNPLLTATLHPNTYATQLVYKEKDTIKTKRIDPFTISGKFNWQLYPPGENCLDPLTENYSGEQNPSACYRKEPLIRAILNEDFQINIGNNWSDHNGGNEIENAINSMKTLAPYKNEIGGSLKGISEAFERLANNGDTGKTTARVANWAKNQASKLSSFMENQGDKLNGTLVIQGTRFSYYGGTSTNFGNLTMRFTLFADWKIQNGEPVFMTVHDQLNEIYPYVMGKFRPIQTNLENSKITKAADNALKGNYISDAAGTIDDFVETYFGWQDAPGGFQASVRSIDTCQKGTFRLILGGYYTIENLVISDMNVNLSKTMCKIPPKAAYSTNELYSGISVEGNRKTETPKVYTEVEELLDKEIKNFDEYDMTPLYADVTINLKPASSYTNNSLSTFTSNKKGMANVRTEMLAARTEAIEDVIQKKRDKQGNIYRDADNLRATELLNISRGSSSTEGIKIPEIPEGWNVEMPKLDKSKRLNNVSYSDQELEIRQQNYDQWNNY